MEKKPMSDYELRLVFGSRQRDENRLYMSSTRPELVFAGMSNEEEILREVSHNDADRNDPNED